MKPEATVLAGYGFNADAELAEALEFCGASVRRMHLSDLLAEPESLGRTAILAFPGGFSFGDHLGSGQLAALLCRRSLGPELERFIASGGLMIGICNGFQVLVKLGILPGGVRTPKERAVTLINNESGKFVDAWVSVRFESESRCLWTRGLENRMLPVRHGEGRFVTKDDAALRQIEDEGLVALRYLAESNPNGSVNDIAGICDHSGRILGMMPHPEAYLTPENHPLRRRSHGDRPALDLFENGIRAARSSR